MNVKDWLAQRRTCEHSREVSSQRADKHKHRAKRKRMMYWQSSAQVLFLTCFFWGGFHWEQTLFFGDALITWFGVHRLHRLHRLIAQSWKYWTFWATSCDTVPQQQISVEILPMSMTLTLNQIQRSKHLLLCVKTVELQQHDSIHHGIILWTNTRCC